MDNDLKKIKKLYGENMMHLCRDLFPTLLEKKGLLPKLLTENFYPTKFLYDDIKGQHQEINFKNYIYECMGIKNNNLISTNKTPKELLSDAGYDLYECNSEKDIQDFKKYYELSERLCTFNGGRLSSCYVFFAVKKNVDEIKREHFLYPKRQDDYGTSVISIQFTKGKTNTLSIKNRYNHTVNNPDATFSNNLENIIPGLTKSFEKEYGLNINQNQDSQFELMDYVKANDGKFYKYNYELNNIYYCPNNIIIDNFEVKKYESEKYIILDHFILDLHNKKINIYSNLEDSFIDGIQDIDDIKVIKNSQTGNKEINITTQDNNKIVIEIDKYNRIIGYTNPELKKVGNCFLQHNKTLTKLELPNLIKTGEFFLGYNNSLNELEIPNLVEAGSSFMCNANNLRKLILPKLEVVAADFLYKNENLTQLEVPNLKFIDKGFLYYNKELKNLSLPSVIKIGTHFLCDNIKLETFDAPQLEEIGNEFLIRNSNLTHLNFPNLIEIGHLFLMYNNNLETFIAPKLERVADEFLFYNDSLKFLELPNLTHAGSNFLCGNTCLESIEVPNLVFAQSNFLSNNRSLTSFKAPSLQKVGFGILKFNQNIKRVVAPNLDKLIRKQLKYYYFEIVDSIPEDDLYETTIVDVSKDGNENKKEPSKMRCKNGQ